MIKMPNIRGDDVSLSSLPSKSASTKSNGSSSKQPSAKKKRNLPGTPDPAAEVVALSPTTLKATNRFICEICNKGFQRDQNLQLHRRGHNLPWKLKRRTKAEVRKRVYICPEPTCMHHDPTRALGDLTGIKKHYNRKHGEKKWKCDKCSKRYAVQSDWKAHQKTCGTKEYRCDCGTIFSRKDSFINHRAFCDALAEEDNEMNHGMMGPDPQAQTTNIMSTTPTKNDTNGAMGLTELNSPVNSLPQELLPIPFKPMNMSGTDGMFLSSSGTLFGTPKGMTSSPFGLLLNPNSTPSGYNCNPEIPGSANFSLLQKAAEIGATASNLMNSSVMQQKCFVSSMPGPETLSIDNVRSCNNFTAQLVRNEQHAPFNAGFATQFMDKSPAHDQEVTDKRTGGAGGSAVIYDGMPMKTVVEVQNNSDQSSTRMQGRNLMATTPIRLLGENDAMTVEFLGPRNLDDSRLELELEQTIQMMHNPFHHQL